VTPDDRRMTPPVLAPLPRELELMLPPEVAALARVAGANHEHERQRRPRMTSSVRRISAGVFRMLGATRTYDGE
jgi:hypothetical protein